MRARKIFARRFGASQRRNRVLAALLAVVLLGGVGQTAAFAVDGAGGDTAAQAAADGQQGAENAATEPGESTSGQTNADPNASADAETADGGASDESVEEHTTEDPAPAPAASRQRNAVPAPLAAPVATNTAVISVSVAGDRKVNSADRTGLAGVTLRLYDGTSNGAGNAVSEQWATCVSDANGNCKFTVPHTQPEQTECRWFSCWVVEPAGENHNRQFWVGVEAAPAGWFVNPQLEVGAGTATKYMFRTGSKLVVGNTYESGTAFMTYSSSGTASSSGAWAMSRNNPEVTLGCRTGVKVALVLDLSGSVAGSLGDLKNSAKSMVDALKGTGSSVALFTFADASPRNNKASGMSYPLMTIDGGTNLNTIKSRIDKYESGGGTNWDEGLYSVAASKDSYDLAVIVTDGLPTFSGGTEGRKMVGPGSSTQFEQVERAISSANAIKAQGTRVLAVGVGQGINGSSKNLSAISGQNKYVKGSALNDVDYFQADWKQLSSMLEGIALGATCQATVDVSKLTIAYGAKSPVSGGEGWNFNATSSGATLKSGAQRTTNAQGKASYQLEFGSPTAKAAQVSLSEAMTNSQKSAGWSLQSVSCSVNGGSAQQYPNLAANLQVGPGDQVSCEFTNVQRMVPGVTIEKRAWDTPDPAKIKGSTELVDGAAVASGRKVSWSYLVTNTGQTTLTDITVTDDKVASVNCPTDTLQAGKSMTCTASGPVTAQ